MAKIEVFGCGHPKLSWNLIANKGYTDGKERIRCRYCMYAEAMERQGKPVKTFFQYTVLRISGYDWREKSYSIRTR